MEYRVLTANEAYDISTGLFYKVMRGINKAVEDGLCKMNYLDSNYSDEEAGEVRQSLRDLGYTIKISPNNHNVITVEWDKPNKSRVDFGRM